LWGDRSGEPPGAVRELAAMTVALSDGLAVQVLAEPGSVDVQSILAMWRSFMETTLALAVAQARTAAADPRSLRSP
jgi:hypothetical protein